MKTKFEQFLEHLKTEDNKVLIETIQDGFNTIVESYADLREERVSALDQFNDMVAMSNPILSFLKCSKMELPTYKEDQEPELDFVPTSSFNQYNEPIPQKDEIQEDLGKTASELMELNF